MKERHLTVYESPGPDPTTPQIRLQGKWLAQIGFEVGKKILVSYEDGKLVIQLDTIIPAND